MTEQAYRISNAPELSRQFRELVATARQRGILAEFFQAASWIISELKATPLEFGEGRYAVPGGSLLPRFATVRPLHVEFAVHEAGKTVFLRRFKLVKS
jgi:hypothetical protein